MSARLTGWTAAILATLVVLALVAGELTDAAQRRWWGDRPLTTDTVSGLLVLLITVLVVNQLLNRRQSRQRGHAIGAQAAILVAQAGRSAKATASVLDGSGDRDAASDGFRTYMMMLLTSAPVLMAIRSRGTSSSSPSTSAGSWPARSRRQTGKRRTRDAIQRIGQTAEDVGRLVSSGVIAPVMTREFSVRGYSRPRRDCGTRPKGWEGGGSGCAGGISRVCGSLVTVSGSPWWVISRGSPASSR